MKFYNHRTMFNQRAGYKNLDHIEKWRDFYQTKNLELIPEVFRNRFSMEAIWHLEDRPYYNVWPVMEEMIRNASLDLPVDMIKLPEQAILVRFSEKSNLDFVLLCADDAGSIGCLLKSSNRLEMSQCAFDLKRNAGMTVNEVLDTREVASYRSKAYGSKYTSEELFEETELAMRTMVAITLLSGDANFITPVPLTKDFEKWNAGDEETRKRLIEKAFRRTGQHGFDVGREVEEQHSATPHLRIPHLCLFWTGKGRKTPRMQLRKGAVIGSKKITEVPTGYLERENGKE